MSRLRDKKKGAHGAPDLVDLDLGIEQVAYLRELPKTWARAKGGKGRAMLASALFDRIDVLGMREATVHLSAHAVRHGLAAVLPAEFDSPVSGRGERIRADTPSRSLLIPVTNVPTSASSDAAPRFGQHQAVARAFSRPSRIRSRPYSKSSP